MAPNFAFRTDVDSPMGQSLRDPQLGYARALRKVQRVVELARNIEVNIHGIKVAACIEWCGIDENEKPCSAASAQMSRGTVKLKAKIKLMVWCPDAGVKEDGLPYSEERMIMLEIPCVVGHDGQGRPPDAGFFMVKGVEYIIRYHERRAYNWWSCLRSETHGSFAEIHCPPQFPGAMSYMHRISEVDGRVGVYTRRGRFEYCVIPLPAALRLLGNQTAAQFAARVCDPHFSIHNIARAWPADELAAARTVWMSTSKTSFADAEESMREKTDEQIVQGAKERLEVREAFRLRCAPAKA